MGKKGFKDLLSTLSTLPAVLFGKWTDHVKSWKLSELGERIMFITYEEMVQVVKQHFILAIHTVMVSLKSLTAVSECACKHIQFAVDDIPPIAQLKNMYYLGRKSLRGLETYASSEWFWSSLVIVGKTTSQLRWPHQCNVKIGHWTGNTNAQWFFSSGHIKSLQPKFNPTQKDLSLSLSPLISRLFFHTKRTSVFIQSSVSYQLIDLCLPALLSGPPCSSQAHGRFSWA